MEQILPGIQAVTGGVAFSYGTANQNVYDIHYSGT